MNSLISLLETVDGKTLPLLILLFLLAAALFFAYRAYKSRLNRESPNMLNKRGNPNALILRSKWIENPDYHSVLHGEPPSKVGLFQGWFDPELQLCGDFLAVQQKLESEKGKYPSEEIEWLKIVNEANRKPMPMWIWGLLLVLLAAEALGFSLIMADLAFTTVSLQLTEIQGYVISGVVAFIALTAAHFTAHRDYLQSYIRKAWALAPKEGFGSSASLNKASENDSTLGTSKPVEKDINKTLGIADNEIDKGLPQAVRIANRSDDVAEAAKKMTLRGQTDRPIPRFHASFWAYVIGVILVGAFIAHLRFDAIEKTLGDEVKAAQMRSDAVGEDFGSESSSSEPTRPPVVDQSRQESNRIMTQEAIEAGARAQRTAVLMFVIIFYLVQGMALVISANYGFAIKKTSREAYDKILQFKKLHGDISLQQYLEKINHEIISAGREAQATLHKWQIGLQTAYANLGNKIGVDDYIKECIVNSNKRTYDGYVKLAAPVKPDATGNSEPRKVDPSELAARGDVTPSPISHPPQPIMNDSVQYYLMTSGDPVITRCSFADLRTKVADAAFESAQLMVRKENGGDGLPSSWQSYAEFVKGAKST